MPAGNGPTLCLGYWDDADANAALFTADGWMRMGDLATIDADGYLTVVGRTSDFIIRGGKNISAAQVEDEVGSHPAVALCAAVAMPDETFGERVCVFVELRAGDATLDARRAARAPRERGHRQGALARAARGRRRAAALVGRQDREGRAAIEARSARRSPFGATFSLPAVWRGAWKNLTPVRELFDGRYAALVGSRR